MTIVASLIVIATLTLTPDRGDAAGLARRPFLIFAGASSARSISS
jgi:hypothetical protein